MDPRLNQMCSISLWYCLVCLLTIHVDNYTRYFCVVTLYQSWDMSNNCLLCAPSDILSAYCHPNSYWLKIQLIYLSYRVGHQRLTRFPGALLIGVCYGFTSSIKPWCMTLNSNYMILFTIRMKIIKYLIKRPFIQIPTRLICGQWCFIVWQWKTTDRSLNILVVKALRKMIRCRAFLFLGFVSFGSVVGG